MENKPKDRLRKAREDAGYPTPSEAARALPRLINRNTLISNENGNREVSRKAAEKYAKAFGVSAGWILYGDGHADDGPGADDLPVFTDVPLISWVSAGQLRDEDAVVDLSEFSTVTTADLPTGDWIALKVDGPSMNKISPPDSIVFVNRRDKRLVANACYIIADETGAATYKRYRPSEKPPFQPASYDDVKPPKLEGAITVVGRVRRSIIDM